MLTNHPFFKALCITLLLGTFHPSAKAGIRIFACEPEWAALAKTLGGEQVKVYSATNYLQDPHHIQARPGLIAKVRRADMITCTGAGLENDWLPLLLRKASNPRIQPNKTGYFMATRFVPLLNKPTTLDRSMGDVHAAGNPHIQLDPNRILQVARKLSERFARLDPDNKTVYTRRFNDFAKKWTQSIQQWEDLATPLHNTLFVSHHKSWPYLANWLGMQEIATLEPKPGIPPSTAHLKTLLETIRSTPPDLIIYASYQDERAAMWLSDKTGIPAVALPFSVPPGDNLFTWYDKLIKRLTEHLHAD